jgi:hypothetical protein
LNSFQTDGDYKGFKQKETYETENNCFICVDKQQVFLHEMQDPFARCLQSMNELKFSDLVNDGTDLKLLDAFPLIRYLLFPLKKHMQGIQPVDKMLELIHWIFHFT